MALIPKLPLAPLFGGSGGTLAAGLDLPQAIVTADDPPESAPADDREDAAEEAPTIPPAKRKPVDTPAAEATITRQAAGGRILQAEALAFSTLSEAPYPREQWVGVPVGAPVGSNAHSMSIHASAADKAQIIASRGQTGDGAAITTTPLVLPTSGCWVRVTADVTLHVLVFGF